MTGGFDEAGLLYRLMDDGNLCRRLVQVFLDDLPARLEHLQHLLDADDLQGLDRAAHSLKGGAGNLGANSVAEAAARLSQVAREQDRAAVTEALAALREATREVTPLMRSFVERE